MPSCQDLIIALGVCG